MYLKHYLNELDYKWHTATNLPDISIYEKEISISGGRIRTLEELDVLINLLQEVKEDVKLRIDTE
jgi:ribosomal protein L9